MKDNNTFSIRTGYKPKEAEITVREDAPKEIRHFVREIAYKHGFKPSDLRHIITGILKVIPDTVNNWGEYPNIDREVKDLLDTAEWYHIYDVIELLCLEIKGSVLKQFQQEINELFIQKGIGWKLENSKIEFRGSQDFENTIHKTEDVLEECNKQTAKNEIKEAIKDLSRKPNPDITGAIQHSVACLECICRETTGSKETLGRLISRNKNIVPSPIDDVIEKIWAFSSNNGRHLQEGKEPSFEEAELLVGLCASITTYLAKKISVVNTNNDDSSFLIDFKGG